MLIKALTSRTVWTVVLMFVVGGVQAIQGVFTAEQFIALQAALSLLAVVFKLNPSQTYP